MALTRIEADVEMIGRVGESLRLARFSTLADGTNPDLSVAYAAALDYFGIAPADRNAITDADLDTFDDSLNGRFLDWAEIRALKMCQNFWISDASKEKWPDYEKDREYQIQYLGLLIPARIEEFKDTWERSGVPGVVQLDRGIKHDLRLHRGRRDRRDYGFDF